MALPSQQQQAVEVLSDGDLGFTGLNELTQPAQLQPGLVSAAQNCRFTRSRAEPRLGLAKLPWTNRTTSTALTPQPFGTIYGAIDFRDPNGLEWTIIAADGKVYRTRANNGTTEIPLPAGVAITAPVTFEQCFDGLILFRGETLAELQMKDVDAGFTLVDQTDNLISGADTENPTDGTEPIPFATNGDWVGNRLFIPFSKDLLGISDYLNATRYQGVRSQARINQGSEDALVRFFKFNDNAGIAFKEHSVYVLNNITGDLSTMTLDEVTREYGLAAAKSCVNVGSDVWFLAERRGICSITQTEQNKLQGRDVPASLPLLNTIKRINWQYAGGATAAYYDNKYYLAVPLDDATARGPELVRGAGNYNTFGRVTFTGLIPGATYQWTPGVNDKGLDTLDQNPHLALLEADTFTAVGTECQLIGIAGAAVTGSIKRVRVGVNNAVLVYDFLQQNWAGADTGSGICVQEWIESTYEGARRLFALTVDGFINLWEEMPYDEVAYETLGANLAAGHYEPDGNKTVSVEAGRIYTYVFGSVPGFGLTNGTQILTANGSFVAAGTTVTLAGNPNTQVRDLVQLVTYVTDVEWIAQDTTFRGYTCESPVQKQYKGIPLGRKRFLRLALELETWYPTFTVSVITEGASEEVAVITNASKNFLKYDRPWDAANWNPTNANNDHATKYRQDYAIVLGDDTTASGAIAAGVVYYVEDLNEAASIVYNGATVTAPATFTGVAGVTAFTVASGSPSVYAPGNYFIPGAAGADPDKTQDSTEKYRLPLAARGQQLQVRVQTTRGRVTILNASVEAVLADRQLGSQL